MSRLLTICIALLLPVMLPAQPGLNQYRTVLKQHGSEPVAFINQKLDKHPLVVFDDALHSAYDPFVFYEQLIRSKPIAANLDYIFIEIFPINAQPYIDRFFQAEKKDSTQLLKAFQDDYSGYGWQYRTYWNLLSAIYDVRKASGNKEKLRVVAVSPPVYWEAIQTRKDYEMFQQSLISRDHFMYQTILQHMQQFEKGATGIFLTNTRHAYKNIRSAKGHLYWNTTTFFHQWHPGKAYSVRMHNVFLSKHKKIENNTGKKTTEGLSEYVYTWLLPANGLWDSAYNATTNRPIAIPLQNNVFGKTPYLGNHAPDVLKNATMYHAYDAVIFLRPSHELLLSGTMDFIYTPAFREELKRRIRLLEGDNLAATLSASSVSSLDEYVNVIATDRGVRKNTLIPGN